MENSNDNMAYMSIDKSRISIIIEWNKLDISFLKSLKHQTYDVLKNCWFITNTTVNINLIKEYFVGRLEMLEKIEDKLSNKKPNEIYKNELHIVEYEKGRIKIIAKYRKDLITLIKSFPFRNWDVKNKWWTTVNSEQVINSLEEFCSDNNISIKYLESNRNKIKPRISKESIPNFRKCPKEYIDKLLIMRYSKSTINSYQSSFEEFINYYHTKKINEISEPEILQFLRYLVAERHVSTSYQNISINAIKFYFERVLKETRKFYYVDRPRKEKKLPVVLNKDEIAKMIKLTDNIKHKAILMLIYSAGLRVSEAINIRIEDIDSKRKLIHIKGAKGKKDRTSLLSNKTLLFLREYFKLYTPKEYLFSGQRGGKYAASSIQKIVKSASNKAGILKNVTTHTLRHSFATHLLEKGVNLRYIQTLLGHENSTTTEIYTHVSSDSYEGISSPIDDLDI